VVRRERVTAIDVLPRDTYYGFALDGNHRFVLARSFVVTHNSRLIAELRKIAGPAHQIFHGEGTEMERNTSYHTWKDMMQTAVEGVVANKESLASEFGPHVDVLKSVFESLKLPDNPKTQAMSGQARAEQLHKTMLRMLRRIAQPGSILILESAQWLDSASWSLLYAVCARLKGLLILVSLRPGKIYPLEFYQISNMPTSRVMQIEPFAHEAETAALVQQASGLADVPKDVTAAIHRKAQGNPFVTQEMVISLIELSYIEQTNPPRLKVAEALAFIKESMPRTVQALVSSKVDRLTAEQQMILKFASVIGMTFSVNFLAKLLPKETSRDALEQDLKLLASTRILRLVSSPSNMLVYSFISSFVHDVVYNMMLFAQKRKLHGEIAAMTEKEHGGTRSFYPLLGMHFKNAEKNEQAYQYFLKAGSAAAFNFANKEAKEFFEDALELVQKTNNKGTLDHIALERKLGLAYYNLGVFDHANEHLRRGLEILDIHVPASASKLSAKAFKLPTAQKKRIAELEWAAKREAVLLLVTLARVLYYDNKRTLAHYCVFVGLKVAKGNPQLSEELYPTAVLTHAARKEPLLVEQYIQKGTASRQTSIKMLTDLAAGMYSSGMGRWEDAELSFRSAQDLATEMGDKRTWEESTIFRATAYFLKGDVRTSVRYTEEALESSRSRGDVQMQIMALAAQARNLHVLGKHDDCEQILARELAPAFKSLGYSDTSMAMNYHALYAAARAVANDLPEAFEQATKCADIVYSTEPTTYFTAFAHVTVPEVYMRILAAARAPGGDTLLAELGNLTKSRLLSLHEKMLSQLKVYCDIYPIARPRAALWRGVACVAAGKSKDAQRAYRDSVDSARELHMLYDEALARYYRGHHCGDKGDTDKSAELLAQIGVTWKADGGSFPAPALYVKKK